MTVGNLTSLRNRILNGLLDFELPSNPKKQDFKLSNDNNKLPHLVQSEYPYILNYLTSQWKVVCCLREYVYRATPWAISTESQALKVGEEHWSGIYSGQITLEDHFQFMHDFKGGHFCGTTAAILTALAQSFGYEAWYVGAGLQSHAVTHAQTLIKIFHDGESLYTLHDPTINISYTYKDGKTPISYFKLLALLVDGKDTEISKTGTVEGGKNPRATILAFEDDFKHREPENPASYGWLIDLEDYELVCTRNGGRIVHSPRSYESYEKHFSICYRPILEAAGYGGKSIYLNLLPFQVSGVSPVESRRLLNLALRVVKGAGRGAAIAKNSADPPPALPLPTPPFHPLPQSPPGLR